MSVHAGPNNNLLQTVNKTNISGLVIDSLQLYYDLGRKFSYSGSGSVLKDLSNNARDVTMYNAGGATYSLNSPGSPSFLENRMGEFVFDGNDFGKFSTINAGSAITVSVWCKTTNTDRENGIISHCSGGPVNLGYSIAANKMKYWYYDTTWRTVSSTASVNDGNWKNLVWAKSGTNMVMYINGTQDSSHTLNSSVNGTLVSFGSLWGPCNSDSYGSGTDSYGQCFIGSIGIIMIHSKQLSSTEVTNNYSSHRRRFGL
jgi:hypothetical protein